ncbi:fimbrial protein [Luteibacter sp.]|uniref:fimbrial protein n=1 Tax=Luteibacter sp. TaxID=1886636 RepID=UPI002806926F|nr:fimbrial protein [Luteibacter sp.]MDQ8051232.1 fimbrial protein [Luteibacter sp.]
MKALRNIFISLLPLALLVHAPPAIARYNDCTAPLPMTLSLPSVRVLSNLAVGQAIPGASVGFSIPVTCTNYTIPAGSRWVMSTRAGSVSSTAYPDVFTIATGSTGIGFRVRNASGSVSSGQTYGGGWAFDMAAAPSAGATIAGTFELVKIATTVLSGVSSIPFEISVRDQEYANQSSAGSILTLSYTVAAVPTCSAAVPSMQVRLPTVSRSSLNGLNATSARTPFDLGLNCDANAAPTVTLSDSTTPSNGTDRLSLTAASTATGVALQLLSARQPVVFSSTGSPGSGTAIRPPSQAGAGLVNVPLEVQYIQNGASVSPGTVNAVALFTLSYP